MRVLPRHWDGRRLLRFLAGLAMLALAFTAHPPAPEPVTPVAAVVAPAPPAPVRAAPAAAEPGSAADMTASLPPMPAPAPVAIIAGGLVLLAGVALRVHAGRAPPAA